MSRFHSKHVVFFSQTYRHAAADESQSICCLLPPQKVDITTAYLFPFINGDEGVRNKSIKGHRVWNNIRHRSITYQTVIISLKEIRLNSCIQLYAEKIYMSNRVKLIWKNVFFAWWQVHKGGINDTVCDTYADIKGLMLMYAYVKKIMITIFGLLHEHMNIMLRKLCENVVLVHMH